MWKTKRDRATFRRGFDQKLSHLQKYLLPITFTSEDVTEDWTVIELQSQDEFESFDFGTTSLEEGIHRSKQELSSSWRGKRDFSLLCLPRGAGWGGGDGAKGVRVRTVLGV